MTLSTGKISGIIFSYLLKGIVFALPLFFFPWTAVGPGMDNFGKQNLLWLAVMIAAVFYLLKAREEGRIVFLKTRMELPLLFFFVIYIAAAIFGIDVFSSFFGQYAAFNFPVATLFALMLFGFFIFDLGRNRKEIKSLLNYFLSGYAAAVAAALLLFFNIGSRYFLPAFGNLNDFAVYLAVADIVIFRLFLPARDIELKRWQTIAVKTLFVFSLVLLLFIDHSPALLILFLGVLATLSLWRWLSGEPAAAGRSIWQRLKPGAGFGQGEIVLLIIFLLVIASIFILTKDEGRALAQNLTLDRAASRSVTMEALKSRPLLGYGADNFGNVFSLYRPLDLNYTGYWNLRFNRAGTFICEIMIGSGLLGAIFYILFLMTVLYQAGKGCRWLKTAGRPEDHGLYAAVFMAWLGSAALQFIYPFNTNLLFVFWLLTALLLGLRFAADGSGRAELKFTRPRNGIDLPLAGIFLSATIVLAALVCQGRSVTAEYYFKQDQAGIGNVETAARTVPYRSVYHVTLAKLYLQRSLELIGNGQDKQAAEGYINRSINAAKEAIRHAPRSVVANETLGVIYRELSPYSQGTNDLAVAFFEQAVRLEPANPVLITELGKLYQANGKPDKAVAAYEQALDVKNDYAEAKFALGRAYEDKEDWDKALSYFQELAGNYNAASLNYELGKVYFNKKNYAEAIKYFQDVLAASPTNINAVYSIGLSFEAAGEYEQALFNYNKALKIDPGNQEITDRIKSLNEKMNNEL